MAGNPTFVLDTNVFVQAARRYYAFDLAPGFWVKLIQHAGSNDLCSIDRVKNELERGKDDLSIWAENHFAGAFASTDDEEIIRSYRDIMNWVQTQNQFSDAAKSDFARGADGWLVAYAKVKGYVVVTQEKLDPVVKRKVPIPNVCRYLDIPFIDTFEMLRRLGVQLT